jgi:hypothetical protein
MIFLDDFLPQNYIVDGIQKLCNTELYQKTNEYGKYVIELCTEAQLRILNGRTIGDYGNISQVSQRLFYHN